MANKRVLLGLGIIAGGVCASLPFRHEAPLSLIAPADAAVADGQETPLADLRAATTSSAPTGPAAASPYRDASSWLGGDQVLPALFADEENAPRAKQADKSLPVPLLSASFHEKRREEIQGSWKPAEEAREEGFLAPSREYRIRKLDTLEDLAERFLGSRERAQDLFEANRNVLQTPQVLPLGAVIRIPADLKAPASESGEDRLLPVRDAVQE